MRAVSCVVIGAVLAACAAPARTRLQVGGIHADPDFVYQSVVIEGAGPGTEALYVVTCPRSRAGGIQSDECWWQRAGTPESAASRAIDDTPRPMIEQPPAAPTGRSQLAIEDAARASGCPLADIALESSATENGIEAYWLIVCEARQLYQWDERQRRFVARP